MIYHSSVIDSNNYATKMQDFDHGESQDQGQELHETLSELSLL